MLKFNGHIKESVDWNTLIKTGTYQIESEPFKGNSSNYPENIYPYGILYVTRGTYTDVIQQIYFPHDLHSSTNAILAHRMKYSDEQGFRKWEYAYENDYTSISLNINNGYIVFRNRLTIQYGNIQNKDDAVNIALALTLTQGISGFATFNFPSSSATDSRQVYMFGGSGTKITIINSTYSSTYKAVNWIYFGYI